MHADSKIRDTESYAGLGGWKMWIERKKRFHLSLILSFFKNGFDIVFCLVSLRPSKPAEPLCPSGDMTLNSGGFFLPSSRSFREGRGG